MSHFLCKEKAEIGLNVRLLIIAFRIFALNFALPFGTCYAVTINFEKVAPAGSYTNGVPINAYSESGFTLTPTNNKSAIFDAGAATTMPGNNTSWFGFASSNTIILTDGANNFDLLSLLLGPSDLAGGKIDFTILGTFANGNSVTDDFKNLISATTAVLNWSNLTSVSFSANNDAGVDNLEVNTLPEPLSLGLMGLGLIGMAILRR